MIVKGDLQLLVKSKQRLHGDRELCLFDLERKQNVLLYCHFWGPLLILL